MSLGSERGTRAEVQREQTAEWAPEAGRRICAQTKNASAIGKMFPWFLYSIATRKTMWNTTTILRDSLHCFFPRPKDQLFYHQNSPGKDSWVPSLCDGQQTHGLTQNWFSARTIMRYWGWECRGALTHFITLLMREIMSPQHNPLTNVLSPTEYWRAHILFFFFRNIKSKGTVL